MKTCFEEFSSFAEDECSRPPVVFLHGVFMSRKMYRIVAPAIAKKTGRKTYLLDARNHGKSIWSDEMNFDLLVADLVEFMDALNIKRAVIVGNSLGGRTAMNFAFKYPERIDALVVEDMTPRNVTFGTHTFVEMFVEAALGHLAGYPIEMDLEEAKRQLLSDTLSVFHPVYLDKEKIMKHIDMEMVPIVKAGDTFSVDSNVEAILQMLRSNCLVQDLPQKNLVFNGDALFLYGSKAFFNLEKDRSVKIMFPRAVVKKVEGASHLIHLDSPEEYAKIVSEFILHRNGHLSKY